jgi:hypothetical protein
MSRKLGGLIALAFCGVIGAGNFGCAIFKAEGDWPMHEAALGDGRTVGLREHWQKNAALRGPKYNCAELSLLVSSPEGLPVMGGVADKRSGEDANDAPRYSFGPLEARADQGRTKVWIVDTSAARVVASLDCATGALTGPDDPAPPWATADGGMRLNQVERRS